MDKIFDTSKPPCATHHFTTRTFTCAEHGSYKASHCDICDLTITGLYIGEIPPCAVHYHGNR